MIFHWKFPIQKLHGTGDFKKNFYYHDPMFMAIRRAFFGALNLGRTYSALAWITSQIAGHLGENWACIFTIIMDTKLASKLHDWMNFWITPCWLVSRLHAITWIAHRGTEILKFFFLIKIYMHIYIFIYVHIYFYICISVYKGL